jgi:hypothetical protein
VSPRGENPDLRDGEKVAQAKVPSSLRQTQHTEIRVLLSAIIPNCFQYAKDHHRKAKDPGLTVHLLARRMPGIER